MSDSIISPTQTDQLDLVYGLNDRPKPFIAFLAAFQHLLAIIVPIVTPGLLICLALGVFERRHQHDFVHVFGHFRDCNLFTM